MSCNEECRVAAMHSHHKYEFGLTASADIPFDLVPVRIFTTPLAMFNGDLKSMFECAKATDLDDDDTTVFDIDYTRKLTPFGRFAPIYCMVNQHEQRNDSTRALEITSKALFKAKVICKIGEAPAMGRINKLVNHFNTQRSPATYLKKRRPFSLMAEERSMLPTEIVYARSVDPFQNLFDHSCVPNVIATP